MTAPLKSWHCGAFLIVAAIIYYIAGRLIVIGAGFVLFAWGWIWLSHRFPTTMTIINGVLAMMLRMGRR